MKNVLKEFKEFAVKGNVIDLAVGVIIGGAFGKIVSSLVTDIIMPPIGLLTGGIDFSSKVIVLKKATESAQAITVNYGIFLNNVLAFLIVSFSIFIFVRYINKLKRKAAENKTPTEPPLTTTEKLLCEIKDILKEKK
jgi:large conductance mechanosensitive channel